MACNACAASGERRTAPSTSVRTAWRKGREFSSPASYPQPFNAAATLKMLSFTSSCALVVCAGQLAAANASRQRMDSWNLNVRIPPKVLGSLSLQQVGCWLLPAEQHLAVSLSSPDLR